MTIEIRNINDDRATRKDFLSVVDTVFAQDPYYVRPLDMDVSDRMNRKKNPFYDHGDACGWVAYDNGRPVGRISASIDELHLERHKDGVGFFGFFDTIDDAAVSTALLGEAEAWLRSRGCERIRGPISLNHNEEMGCLVDGFDTPPMVMMGHHMPYQGRLIEEAGLTKLKDLYAWDYDVGRVPKRAQKGHDAIAALPEVTARPIDMKRLDADVRSIMEVYNDAWSENWAFVPATDAEMAKMAQDLKLIAMPAISRLVFIDGEVAAVALALPNLNELIHDAKGQLFPFGALKLWWRLRVQGPKSGRMVILGIRKKWRRVRRYAALSAYLYTELNQAGHLLGIQRGELSWTLEDNGPINTGIKMMGGRIYKTYRIYERPL